MTAAWAYELAVDRYPRKWLNRTAVARTRGGGPLLYALIAYLYGRHALTTNGNVSMVARQETLETMLHSALRTTVILLVILGPVWMLKPFVNRTTKWLAELSYGVYLIHWLIIIYPLTSSRGCRRTAPLVTWRCGSAIVRCRPRSFSRRSRDAGSSCRSSAGCWAGRPPRRRSEVLRRLAAPVRPSGANRLWPPARIDAPAGDRPDRRRAVADLIDFRAGAWPRLTGPPEKPAGSGCGMEREVDEKVRLADRRRCCNVYGRTSGRWGCPLPLVRSATSRRRP